MMSQASADSHIMTGSHTLLQVVLLSATMPDEVLEVTKKFMRNPVRILVKKDELTLEGINVGHFHRSVHIIWV